MYAYSNIPVVNIMPPSFQEESIPTVQIKIVLTEKLSLSFIIVNYFKTLKRYSGGAIHNECIVRVISINI